MRRFLPLLTIAGASLLVAPAAHAAGHLDDIVTTYRDASNGWLGASVTLGRQIFFMFVGLEILLTLYAAGFAFFSGRFAPGSLLATAIRKLLIFSLALLALQSFPIFVPELLRFFQTAGARMALLNGISPSALLDWGVLLASQIILIGAQAGLLAFSTWSVCLLCALILLTAFALMAYRLTVLLIEAIILVTGLALFLGFASNRFTIPLCENYLVSVIRCGVRTLLLYLFVAVASQLVPIWALTLYSYQTSSSGFATLLRVTAEVAIFAVVALRLPDRLAYDLTAPSSFLQLRQALVGNE